MQVIWKSLTLLFQDVYVLETSLIITKEKSDNSHIGGLFMNIRSS